MAVEKSRVVGGRDIAVALKALPSRTAKNVLSGMVRAGGRPIRDEARARVRRKTGLGAKSIVVRNARSKTRTSARAIVTVLKRAFYLRFLEFGTRHAPAFPFLRPAAETKQKEAIREMGNYAGPRIEKEAAKLARKARGGR
jgi:HK97 gp10 family phage protein